MWEIKYRAYAKQLNKKQQLKLRIFKVLILDFEDEDIFAVGKGGGRYKFSFEELEGLVQYIGLKDRNDTEIYEGDIVKYSRHRYTKCDCKEIEKVEPPVTGKIYFVDDLWPGLRFADGTGTVFLPGTIRGEDFEVIGNIYENPELLGVDE
ncbi:YopX family protein [Domibacillus aminovorans]|uniref:YopX protein domain-containing protein n=1 Tax=Domibacillus aminovorans TaxID=29332 RepID=A0A177L465_9BACI|nr:YopX family protein [Domibacillus aminovorans]OAH60095.1 hypothetical protein AWH49_17985 [Domibacillus aminovorans]